MSTHKEPAAAPPPTTPVQLTPYAAIPGYAVTGIFLILTVQALVWAGEFLIPVTAAMLGYFVLNRPRRWLEKFGIAPVVSVAILTLFLTTFVVVTLINLSGPVAQFIDDMPSLMAEIDRKLNAAGGTLQTIDEASQAAEDILSSTSSQPETVEVQIASESGLASMVVGYAPAMLSQLIFAQLLLFFLVASGDMFVLKAVESFPLFKDKRRAVNVIRAIENRLGRYLGGITAINAGLGVCIGIAMAIWGLPSVIFLGVMGFALNFVPFLGGLFGASIAAAIAFVSLNGTWPALGVFLTYMALTSIEGQLITPALISRRMKLNTPVVFLSVAFFAWIWSVIGMVVALPILIVIKIVCDETGQFTTLSRFIGDIDGKQNESKAAAEDAADDIPKIL